MELKEVFAARSVTHQCSAVPLYGYLGVWHMKLERLIGMFIFFSSLLTDNLDVTLECVGKGKTPVL